MGPVLGAVYVYVTRNGELRERSRERAREREREREGAAVSGQEPKFNIRARLNMEVEGGKGRERCYYILVQLYVYIYICLYIYTCICIYVCMYLYILAYYISNRLRLHVALPLRLLKRK